VQIEIPEKLSFLFENHRYKVARGGRGSSKSWSYARALIAKAISQKTRILCCREIQNSIKESVHRLLCDQIETLGVNQLFNITDKSIKCKNGSEFIFEGLLRNADRIKSYEGIDICWVEEAHHVSEESWQFLVPTIRTEGSEIWVTYNPDYEDDPVHKRYVTNKPEDCVSALINFQDNPWFPEVLRKELERDKATNETIYRHVWLGEPVGAGAKIWHAYDESVHVQDFAMSTIKEKGQCFMGMDPHSKFYPAIIWIARVPKNQNKDEFWNVVYNEYPTYEDLGGYYSDLRKSLYFTGSLSDLSRAIWIKDGTAEHGVRIHKRFIDTRFAKGAGGTNWSTDTVGIVEQFAKTENGGMKMECPAEKTIDIQRENILKAMLYNKLIPIGTYNSPDLIVLPHCRNVRQSLSNHRCVEGEEKEDDKYKDFSDALRICFAGMQDEKYKDPLESVKPRVYQFEPRGAKGWMA
jgi:hypothetical protein